MLLHTAILILTVGSVQGFILSFFLLSKKGGNRIANIILGLNLLFFSYNMFVPGIIRYYHEYFPHLCATGFPLMFLYGPGMYLYALFITGKRVELKKSDLLHLLPFIVSVIVMIPFYSLPADVKVTTINSWKTNGLPPDAIAGWALECIHLSAYMVVCYLYLRRYSSDTKDNYSSMEKINLEWLYHLVSLKTVVWVIYSASFLLVVWGIEKTTFVYLFTIFSLSASVLTYYVGFKGLMQPAIFAPEFAVVNHKRSKYERSGLNESMTNSYHDQLIDYMHSQRPYRDPNLTLGELAAKLEMPANYLSQVINEKVGLNFFDFINSYRVQEVQKALVSPANRDQTVMQIAFGEGFNSKSTFNAAFKKFTQTTPTSYRKAYSDNDLQLS